jgi:deoxyribose-phosphate aldolase
MWFKKKKEEPAVTDEKSIIDFTLLDPRATTKDIHNCCNIAIKNHYYGVCVNSCWVETVKRYLSQKAVDTIAVVSVVGFPLGASSMTAKLAEEKQAISDGADELDVVINIGNAKEGDYDYVRTELSRIVRASHGKVIKAIIETCYFDKEEIIKLVKVCAKAKVDYIKTSTGFGTGGATPEIVQLINETAGGKCKVKASGGIRTMAQVKDMVRAGASRIGTSTEL